MTALCALLTVRKGHAESIVLTSEVVPGLLGAGLRESLFVWGINLLVKEEMKLSCLENAVICLLMREKEWR